MGRSLTSKKSIYGSVVPIRSRAKQLAELQARPNERIDVRTTRPGCGFRDSLLLNCADNASISWQSRGACWLITS